MHGGAKWIPHRFTIIDEESRLTGFTEKTERHMSHDTGHRKNAGALAVSITEVIKKQRQTSQKVNAKQVRPLLGFAVSPYLSPAQSKETGRTISEFYEYSESQASPFLKACDKD